LFGKTPLKAQNDYIFQKFGGKMAPLPPLWLRLCMYPRLHGNLCSRRSLKVRLMVRLSRKSAL